jgi:hypothetical protein
MKGNEMKNLKKNLKWILVIWVSLIAWSCQSTDDKQQTVLQKTRQTELGKIREIHYRRSGGATSNRESLTILNDGQATAESTLFRDGKKTLTEFQMLQLWQWFDNSEKWKSEYSGKKSDAVTEIQYGGSTVRVYESATDVPEDLVKLQTELRELVREVAGQ